LKIAIVSGDDQVGDDPRQMCAALAARGHEATAYVRRQGRQTARADGSDRLVPVPVGPRAAVPAPDVLPYVGDWAAALEHEWLSDPPTSCMRTAGSAGWRPNWRRDGNASRRSRPSRA
jgi:hypothetical protein